MPEWKLERMDSLTSSGRKDDVYVMKAGLVDIILHPDVRGQTWLISSKELNIRNHMTLVKEPEHAKVIAVRMLKDYLQSSILKAESALKALSD